MWGHSMAGNLVLRAMLIEPEIKAGVIWAGAVYSYDDFAKYGIYMNAVDTGWVTDEDPVQLAKKKEEEHDFQPPLDIVDGAARVMDPLFDGINTGKHWCGKFLKDYFPIDW